MWFTQHSAQRAAQRNLSAEEVQYVMWYGQCFRQAGALIYFLRRRDIPAWDHADDRWMRLAGTAVILTKDGRQVITTWRNRRRGLKHIKHKTKFDARPGNREPSPWQM
jgi:hypothetical protein